MSIQGLTRTLIKCSVRRWIWALSLACLSLPGCSTEPSQNHVQVESGPEIKFARFEKELRRLCQEGHATLIADATGGAGLTSIRTAIDPPTAVLHAPQTPDGEHTAEVTLVTRMTYSSLAPEETPEETPSQIKAPKKENPGLLGTEDEDDKPAPPARSLGKQEEFRDTYDLAYREDRWVLISREVPESTRMLLERALSAQ